VSIKEAPSGAGRVKDMTGAEMQNLIAAIGSKRPALPDPASLSDQELIAEFQAIYKQRTGEEGTPNDRKAWTLRLRALAAEKMKRDVRRPAFGARYALLRCAGCVALRGFRDERIAPMVSGYRRNARRRGFRVTRVARRGETRGSRRKQGAEFNPHGAQAERPGGAAAFGRCRPSAASWGS
jgi:hypothetical protein